VLRRGPNISTRGGESKSDEKPPVLITGCSRSGTTWVGKTLRESPGFRYIYEPFNIGKRVRLRGLPLPYQFFRIDSQNEAPYLGSVDRLLRGEWPRRLLGRLLRRRLRPLLKDPLAVFSADWLSRRFDFQVVVLIRHPAAVAASRLRLGWHFDFSHLLGQDRLMHTHLAEMRDEMTCLVAEQGDILDEASVLWKAVYSVVARYRRSHPEWLFVRHEDLCRDPVGEFRRICSYLQIDLCPSMSRYIERSTSEKNSAVGRRRRQHDHRRNSRELIYLWREALTEEQVARIRSRVGPFAAGYYEEHEW
jgi:hypothetical protein